MTDVSSMGWKHFRSRFFGARSSGLFIGRPLLCLRNCPDARVLGADLFPTFCLPRTRTGVRVESSIVALEYHIPVETGLQKEQCRRANLVVDVVCYVRERNSARLTSTCLSSKCLKRSGE